MIRITHALHTPHPLPLPDSHALQVLALREDVRFAEALFRGEGLTRDALEQVRGVGGGGRKRDEEG